MNELAYFTVYIRAGCIIRLIVRWIVVVAPYATFILYIYCFNCLTLMLLDMMVFYSHLNL
ncbi:hypothetical protein V1505DRAFT_375723, partial [Lipomyces doorenjongii]